MHTVRARGVGRLGRRAGRPSSRLVLSPADCSRVLARRATGWRVRICPGPHPRLSSGPWPLCPRAAHPSSASRHVIGPRKLRVTGNIQLYSTALDSWSRRNVSWTAYDRTRSRWIALDHAPRTWTPRTRPGASLAQRGIGSPAFVRSASWELLKPNSLASEELREAVSPLRCGNYETLWP